MAENPPRRRHATHFFCALSWIFSIRAVRFSDQTVFWVTLAGWALRHPRGRHGTLHDGPGQGLLGACQERSPNPASEHPTCGWLRESAPQFFQQSFAFNLRSRPFVTSLRFCVWRTGTGSSGSRQPRTASARIFTRSTTPIRKSCSGRREARTSYTIRRAIRA